MEDSRKIQKTIDFLNSSLWLLILIQHLSDGFGNIFSDQRFQDKCADAHAFRFFFGDSGAESGT